MTPSPSWRLAAAFLVVLVFPFAAASTSVADDLSGAIRGRIVAAERTASASRPDRAALSLRSFYEARDFRPAWIGGARAETRVRTAINVLKSAGDHGLDAASYIPENAADARLPRTQAGRAELDILLSTGLRDFATDLRHGRAYRDAPKAAAATAVLNEMVAARDLTGFFAGLAPRAPEYERLRSALAAYRTIAAGGGWPQLPAGPSLRRGMVEPIVEILRRRLTATGDLRQTASRDIRFDARLEAAVRRFQQRHGLTDDGIVGPKTRAALNVPVEARIEQMRLNLERRRWMPADRGEIYVFVNMADFVLKVVERDDTVMVMKVIVGTPYWRTPLFSAAMTHMEFNPYWNVPRSIAQREIAPKVMERPDYPIRQGIRIFDSWNAEARELPAGEVDWAAVRAGTRHVRLRQDPGPLNPLGRVKFIFPNAFSVYLHDTPARELFDREVRAFSHGCIRIEKPLALAAYLLGERATDGVEALLTDGRTRVVRLERPVPVHLAYLTAWVNKDGTVHFRRSRS